MKEVFKEVNRGFTINIQVSKPLQKRQLIPRADDDLRYRSKPPHDFSPLSARKGRKLRSKAQFLLLVSVASLIAEVSNNVS
jgi:hypothetical protein